MSLYQVTFSSPLCHLCVIEFEFYVTIIFNLKMWFQSPQKCKMFNLRISYSYGNPITDTTILTYESYISEKCFKVAPPSNSKNPTIP